MAKYECHCRNTTVLLNLKRHVVENIKAQGRRCLKALETSGKHVLGLSLYCHLKGREYVLPKPQRINTTMSCVSGDKSHGLNT